MKTTGLKYKEVEKTIRQLAKKLPPGSRIPSERDLAVTHKCNFLTVRKALKTLVTDGTIFRKVGHGSFVALRGGSQKLPPPVPLGNRLGVLVYQQSDAYGQKLLQELPSVAQEMKIELRSVWIQNFGEESLRHAANFVEEGCSAIVLPWFPHHLAREISGFVQQCPLPVSIPLVIPGLEENYFAEVELFGNDVASSMNSLYGYFQHLGHNQIALLGPASPSDPFLQKMLSAYTCLTQEKNLPSLCGLVAPGTTSMDQLAQRWKAHRRDLAIISYDDEHALRFMTAMHKIGLAAPDDFFIIGHNDTDASRFSDPPLSTISQDFRHVSFNLLKKAIALAEGRHYSATSTPVARVLVRSTCGGKGKITPALPQEFSNLEFIVQSMDETETPVKKGPPEIVPA